MFNAIGCCGDCSISWFVSRTDLNNTTNKKIGSTGQLFCPIIGLSTSVWYHELIEFRRV